MDCLRAPATITALVEAFVPNIEDVPERCVPPSNPSPIPGPAAADDPWYKDGLSFTCTQCGNCCTGAPGFVWTTDDDLQKIADFLGKSIGEIRLMHTKKVGRRVSLTEFANGDCTFFDGKTRGCTIYPVRPPQCRTWPFWNSNLESPETWSDVHENGCPGAGRGKLYSLGEIRQRADEVDL